MFDTNLVDNLKRTITSAFFAASDAHKVLFKESSESPDDSRENEFIAAIYVNKAISLISAAKAIYFCNIEPLCRQELEEIFNQFDAFESEFLDNVKTYHSHQWTDIHFDRFKEAYEAFFGPINY